MSGPSGWTGGSYPSDTPGVWAMAASPRRQVRSFRQSRLQILDCGAQPFRVVLEVPNTEIARVAE